MLRPGTQDGLHLRSRILPDGHSDSPSDSLACLDRSAVMCRTRVYGRHPGQLLTHVNTMEPHAADREQRAIPMPLLLVHEAAQAEGQTVHFVHVTAGHPEDRVMLPDRIFVRPIEQAVHLAVRVVVPGTSRCRMTLTIAASASRTHHGSCRW